MAAMTFKEQVAQDNRALFLNMDEFADLHMINGVMMPCIVDNNELINREKRYQYNRSFKADGVFLKELLIYVRAEDFGALPAVGRSVVFDRKTYIISDAVNEDGIYSLCLEANKS